MSFLPLQLLRTKKEEMNIQQAKQIPIPKYLTHLGFTSCKTYKGQHVYNSPIREDRTPSFYATANQWYDFGMGKGGNIVDLALLISKSDSIKDVLTHIETTMRIIPVARHERNLVASYQENENGLQLLKVKRLENSALIQYAKDRGISAIIARTFCKEAYYKVKNKNYFALAFENASGGYELRNKYFKGCTSKNVSFIDRGFDQLLIFEGFFDFLTWSEVSKNNNYEYRANVLVLNSVCNYEKSLAVVKSHSKIQLFLDADNSGRELTTRYTELGIPYVDHSYLYSKNHKDLNEMWVSK